MSGDVIVRGRSLLATGRIGVQYAPVLSEALKELERTRAKLQVLQGASRDALAFISLLTPDGEIRNRLKEALDASD